MKLLKLQIWWIFICLFWKCLQAEEPTQKWTIFMCLGTVALHVIGSEWRLPLYKIKISYCFFIFRLTTIWAFFQRIRREESVGTKEITYSYRPTHNEDFHFCQLVQVSSDVYLKSRVNLNCVHRTCFLKAHPHKTIRNTLEILDTLSKRWKSQTPTKKTRKFFKSLFTNIASETLLYFQLASYLHAINNNAQCFKTNSLI